MSAKILWKCSCGQTNYSHYTVCSACGNPRPEPACCSAWPMLMACLAIAGCSTAPPPQVITQTVYTVPQVPMVLLSCGDTPVSPPKPRTDIQRAQWVADDWQFGQDCHNNLAAVAKALAADATIASQPAPGAPIEGSTP